MVLRDNDGNGRCSNFLKSVFSLIIFKSPIGIGSAVHQIPHPDFIHLPSMLVGPRLRVLSSEHVVGLDLGYLSLCLSST